MARLPERPAPHLTRRGSLAYYLAAWVCGTFFFAAAQFIGRPPSGHFVAPASRNFLFQYFYDLATGWIAILFLAFLLRVLCRKLSWTAALAWTLCGGILTALIGAGMSFLPGSWITRAEWLQFLKEIFELGGENGFKLSGGRALGAGGTVLAGMATAFVLFRVEKAFSASYEASK